MSLFIETTPGIFISESKNRFLCNVKVDDEPVECYVPSSSRLENYLDLNGCEVLLTENKSQKSRTRYSLFAVNYKNSYIILNLNKVNQFIEHLILNELLYPRSKYKIYREKIVENSYKTDFYLRDLYGNNDIIIEAKGVISAKQIVEFPQVFSERSLKQLEIIYTLLEEGKTVNYYLICLSPFIKMIKLIENNEFTNILTKCINRGLELKTISLCFDGKNITLNKDVEIFFEKSI